MSTSSQNSKPKPGLARVELREVICGALVSDKVAEERVDAFEAEALNAAIEAARGEYLHDDTGTPEDAAYNQGVSDVIAAIGKLLEGGAA